MGIRLSIELQRDSTADHDASASAAEVVRERYTRRYASPMRALLLCLLFLACAGPTQGQVAGTSTARTRSTPSLAPPASGEDKERYQLNQEFEDMRDTTNANREINHASAPPSATPAATGSGAPGSSAPAAKRAVKRGPAEQAAVPPPAPTK